MVEKEKAGCKNGLTHTEIPPGEVVVVLFGRNRFGGEMSRCVHGGEGSVLAARTGNCLGGKGSRCVGTPVDRKFNDTTHPLYGTPCSVPAEVAVRRGNETCITDH